MGSSLTSMINVMRAVVLRDIKTRFFDHAIGFLGVSLWPLAHFAILLAIYHTIGRAAPFGNSLNIFFATGLLPTLLFMYVSRFMSVSLMMNKSMLSFPAVKVMDIMLARAFLEIIAAFITLVLVILIIISLGESAMPSNLGQAVLAYLSSIVLAVGVGALAGVISMFLNFFVVLYGLAAIVIYMLSGTLFVASQLPESVQAMLSWNPVLHCVEWMRTAYFETYSDKVLDKAYPFSFGGICFLIALAAERIFRRQMMD